MGVCFSKKKIPIPPPPNEKINNNTKEESTKIEAQPSPQRAPAVEKKQVFVIAQTPKKTSSGSSSAASSDDAKNEKEKPKKSDADPSRNVLVALPKPEGPVRTSSCTKEEVDAILIQCGRLSRSSSGTASNDRKYSGSKRSYDFDNEKAEEADWDHTQASRPSPRRRTPNRERSGSRERGSQRRVSRSPGRRSDGPAASSVPAAKQQQPAKMVSVPAREKGATNTAAAADNANVKRVQSAVANKRNASPRSRSPANNSRASNENAAVSQPQSLSRSSSKKAEQSPFRRNPMTEIDENNRTQKSREGDEIMKRASQIQTQKTTTISNCVRDQLLSCRAKDKQTEPEIVEEAKDSKGAEGLNNHRTVTRTRSSRRSSRDLDNILGLNPDSNNPNAAAAYASLLLDDIHNYHHQNAGFSLPACVTKACSILEAVADLNSSSSDQSNKDNGRFGRRALSPKEPFMESEIVVKDDLMEPSLHKYVSVRDLGGAETEPQESAGSNSFVGPPAGEPNSADSTDRCLNSQPSNMEETSRSRFRGRGSSSNDSLQSSTKNGGFNYHREANQRGGGGVGGVIGKGEGRAYSLPVAAAASS